MRRGIPFPASSFAPFRTRNGIQFRRGKRRENDESIESAQQCSSTNSQRTSTGFLSASSFAPFRTRNGIQFRRGKRRENDESIESAQQCSSTNSQRTSTGLLAA